MAPVSPAVKAAADKPSIALHPFVNMSGDPAQDFFADGVTENIITGLSRFRDLFVIASNSTFAYKGKPVRIQDVSRELGVHYVLEGSVQRSRDRIRITAQLIDGDTGRLVGGAIRPRPRRYLRYPGRSHRNDHRHPSNRLWRAVAQGLAGADGADRAAQFPRLRSFSARHRSVQQLYSRGP